MQESKMMRPAMFILLAEDDNRFERGLEVVSAAANCAGVVLIPIKISQFEQEDVSKWVQEYFDHCTKENSNAH